MKSWKSNLLVFLFFTVLTLVMTYPLILNLGSGVRDMGDPLLNAWIISWNIHKISQLDFYNYFDANIYYPHQRTLAYSEFLFSQALLGFLVQLVSKNPVLTYNFVLLLSFLTSGFAMFLFIRYLVKDNFAGMVAGIIYAFSPFMIAHLFHIQVITAGGIPLAFLYLHKFFASSRIKDVLLFAFFCLLQILANGYYALYLIFFAGLFIIVFVISKRKYRDIKFLEKLAIALMLVVVIAAPFFIQYMKVRSEMGFSREIGSSARITSFLATAPINKLYGKITRRFLISEGELFPGLMTFILASVGIASYLMKKGKFDLNPKKKKFFLVSYRSFNIILILCVLWGLIILISGGFEFSLKGLGKIKAHSLKNLIIFFIFIFIVRWILQRQLFLKRKSQSGPEEKTVFSFYLATLILAFLFTFGSQGPYIFLYKYVPGFNGLRVASRFHIFVMFSLAIFAALCLKNILKRLSSLAKSLISILIPLSIIIEYFSVPIPLQTVPMKKQIPRVYQWLASREKENFALLEIPLLHPQGDVVSLECLRLYYSTYHWKNLVNGYSGYIPPLYHELSRRWLEMPLEQNIKDLDELGVRYLIFHSDSYKEKDLNKIRQEFSEFEGKIKFISQFDEDYVFQVLPEPVPLEKQRLPSDLKLLPKAGWKVKTNVNEDKARLAIDGSLASRWESGPQRKGVYFEIDLGKLSKFQGVSLKLGTSSSDYPRGYFVELSQDGIQWEKVAEEEKTVLPIRAFLKPRELGLNVHFSPRKARFIRIINTGEDPIFYWSIYEIEIFY